MAGVKGFSGLLRFIRLLLRLIFLLSWTQWRACEAGGLLDPGIQEQTVSVPPNTEAAEYLGFPHSAFNGTNLVIAVECKDKVAYQFQAQFVVRSTECDKEYWEIMRSEDGKRWLDLYFTRRDIVPADFKYDRVLYYQSKPFTVDCDKDMPLILEAKGNLDWVKVKPFPTPAGKPGVEGKKKESGRRKRVAEGAPAAVHPTAQDVEQTNERAPPRTTKSSLLLPADAIYIAIVKVTIRQTSEKLPHNITVRVKWEGRQGYLSAIDWPLLPFYGAMCAVYAVFALAWLILSACQWQDLLRIQFWIGAVILLGMVEKAVFYAECQTLNSTGKSVQGAMEFAEIVSCLKRTLARMLVIVVSVGFGVVKPRLGSTLHKVVGVGFIYFILSAIEAMMRVSKTQPDAVRQKKLAELPLILLEVGIFWWIFSSLVATMRALRLRRNEVKLGLYRHFMNTLIFAALASVVFMCWSLFMHTFTTCLKDWMELWVDIAFWHLLFSVILLVIMILWRPTNNNQRYAFTPLLDNTEDEDEEEDTVFSEAFTTAEAMKLRGVKPPPETKAENRRDRSKAEPSLEEELKWVEEHIPSSLADKAIPALVDSDEEAQQTRFEISKMQ